MDIPLTESAARSASGRAFPLHRLGDVALFLVWVVFATANVTGAIGEARTGDWLAMAHHSIVAAVFLVNASLFLLRGPAVRRGKELGPLVVALIGTWAVIPLSMLSLTWRPGWLLALSTVGMIVAYAFVLWALLTLRRSFSIFPEARTLVRHGPYALVRHPLYAAYMLTYVLIALPRVGPWALLLVIVGITGELLRARNEERILAASFADYAEYAAVTPRFVPRIG
ncbi:MAG: isoprenylcysteine carboxylmethyltransferase family protein [Chloroflexia bacterium]|nr:isoprenylcysteine carboxylmethyltransferase family protein [Chloroflexia bacterium]